jgi:hypothetical protein
VIKSRILLLLIIAVAGAALWKGGLEDIVRGAVERIEERKARTEAAAELAV